MGGGERKKNKGRRERERERERHTHTILFDLLDFMSPTAWNSSNCFAGL